MSALGSGAGLPPKEPRPHLDPVAWAKRPHVGQASPKLKQHRRLATRSDKCGTSSQAFVCAPILKCYLSWEHSLARYAGRQYLDNTSIAGRSIVLYYVQDVRVRYLRHPGKLGFREIELAG